MRDRERAADDEDRRHDEQVDRERDAAADEAGVRDGLRAWRPVCPGARPALERSVRLVGAAPQVGHDLVAEVRPLLRERLAQRRARDDAMEGGFELGAREDGLDELRRLPVVERLARDAFHHLVLHERAADRLGQRPGEHVVERPPCLRCREHALGHPLEPPPRVELGLAARRRQHVDATPDERQPLDDAHRPSIDLPAVAPARLTVTASPTTTLRPFVGSVAIVLP